MRFVLVDLKGDKAQLKTRTTQKTFWTDTSDLIFITTGYNIQKAKDLSTEPQTKKAE